MCECVNKRSVAGWTPSWTASTYAFFHIFFRKKRVRSVCSGNWAWGSSRGAPVRPWGVRSKYCDTPCPSVPFSKCINRVLGLTGRHPFSLGIHRYRDPARGYQQVAMPAQLGDHGQHGLGDIGRKVALDLRACRGVSAPVVQREPPRRPRLTRSTKRKLSGSGHRNGQTSCPLRKKLERAG